MGALGKYLSNAREAKGLNLHDAAQQTRISITYLKALEAEDFAKLPGDVFVRGFLKNYGKYLTLPEAEVLQKYSELLPGHAVAASSAQSAEKRSEPSTQKKSFQIPIESLLWGAAIILTVAIFLFTAMPKKQKKSGEAPPSLSSVQSTLTSSVTSTKPEKLYLQVIALDDVWLLIRTDSGPQKKVMLKKGEDVVWSADERFLLSYGNISAVKLLLSGKELLVNGARNSVVRDLTLTAAGILVPKAAPEKQKPVRLRLNPLPQVQPLPQPQPQQQPQLQLPIHQAPYAAKPVRNGTVSPPLLHPELPARTEAPQKKNPLLKPTPTPAQ